MFLAVVTPMANERDTAIDFLSALIARTNIDGDRTIYVIFDRACTDGTIDLVRDFSLKNPCLKMLWRPNNRNVVDAYVSGYETAIEDRADWILEIDAGFSHRPEDVAHFLDHANGEYDCIFGSRFCDGGSMTGSRTRYIVSRYGTWLTNILLGTRLHDMTSGFQMFNRSSLSSILAAGLKSHGPFFQTEMKVYARKLKWKEVPIRYRTTASVTRPAGIYDAFRVLFLLLWDRSRGKLRAATVK